MRVTPRLLAMLAFATATLAGRHAAAWPMHCLVAGGPQAAGSATIDLGRFEGEIDPDSPWTQTPAKWSLSGGFEVFRHLAPRVALQGRFVLVDVALAGNPYLELVVDREAPRAWIRGYIYPDGRIWVREWQAVCDPAPSDVDLPPPPPSQIVAGAPAPNSGPLVPRRRPPLDSEPWRRLIGPLSPAEIVGVAAPSTSSPSG